MDTTDSRWLYASKSSSTNNRFESVVAGTRGAEFVRFVKLGRAVLRGVEFEVVGDALVGRSPRLGSLDELDDRVRLDLVRCGRRTTSSMATGINGATVHNAVAADQHPVPSTQQSTADHPIKLSVSCSYG